MLISLSNNFVFIRAPKTGSTSALFYFLNSGLYEDKIDLVALENPFTSWVQMKEHFEKYSESYIEKAKSITGPPKSIAVQVDVHVSYKTLVGKEYIKAGMPCYSMIRNPIDRLCSIYFYEQNIQKTLGYPPLNNDLNEFCYLACFVGGDLKPTYAKLQQNTYFPDHAKLWNIENLHEHAVADITALGGKVGNRIHVRKTSQKPKDYKSLLSHEVIQMIELKYLKDFELWEKAYAVYN